MSSATYHAFAGELRIAGEDPARVKSPKRHRSVIERECSSSKRGCVAYLFEERTPNISIPRSILSGRGCAG
jgi:hypothetical protein